VTKNPGWTSVVPAVLNQSNWRVNGAPDGLFTPCVVKLKKEKVSASVKTPNWITMSASAKKIEVWKKEQPLAGHPA